MESSADLLLPMARRCCLVIGTLFGTHRERRLHRLASSGDPSGGNEILPEEDAVDGRDDGYFDMGEGRGEGQRR